MEAVMSVQLNQHQAVQSEGSLELAVLAGGCFWGIEDLLPRRHQNSFCSSGSTHGAVCLIQSIDLNL
jgi:hypothetical protein